MLTDKDCTLFDLIYDPTCMVLMKRDGVKHHDVLRLMRSIKPLVARGRPPLFGTVSACPGV